MRGCCPAAAAPESRAPKQPAERDSGTGSRWPCENQNASDYSHCQLAFPDPGCAGANVTQPPVILAESEGAARSRRASCHPNVVTCSGSGSVRDLAARLDDCD